MAGYGWKVPGGGGGGGGGGGADMHSPAPGQYGGTVEDSRTESGEWLGSILLHVRPPTTSIDFMLALLLYIAFV